MAESSERAYRINAETVNRLREGRGWSWETLAAKADVDVATLRAWRNGRRAFLGNIKRLAEALGVTVKDIILVPPDDCGIEEQQRLGSACAPNDGGEATVMKLALLRAYELVLNEDFSKWDEERQKQFFEGLRLILSTGCEIRIIGKAKAGSVKLRIMLPKQESEKLERAFDTGKLQGLKVMNITPITLGAENEVSEPSPGTFTILEKLLELAPSLSPFIISLIALGFGLSGYPLAALVSSVAGLCLGISLFKMLTKRGKWRLAFLALGLIANVCVGVSELVVVAQKINAPPPLQVPTTQPESKPTGGAKEPKVKEGPNQTPQVQQAPTTQPVTKPTDGAKDQKDIEKPKPKADDRAAAEYVKKVQGQGQVKDEKGKNYAINDLPATGAIFLTQVDLLDNKDVDDRGLAVFKDCQNLTWIRLDATNVSDVGLAHLKHTTKLTYLGLGNTEVTDAGLAYFKNNKRLTYLGLFNAKVGDKGISNFEGCKNLMQLQLAKTGITDKGLATFETCQKLEVIDLGETGVTDRGLRVLQKLKALKKLDLKRTNVTANGVKDLRMALPRCEIDWLSRE